MNPGRTLRTAARIPVRQLAARAGVMLARRRYAGYPAAPIERALREAEECHATSPLPRVALQVVAPEGMSAVRARSDALAAGLFRYLHRELDFSGSVRWKDPDASPLWRYQLQYLGAVLDHALCGRAAEARALVSAWSREFSVRWDPEAWHPYPASLRLANLCHAAAALGGFDALGPGVDRLVGAHAAYVLAHLERDVRGNHLIENLRALLVASRFLRGGLAERCARAVQPLLAAEIAEQILPDGGHFELSPMYHCIVLHRLLEMEALGCFGRTDTESLVRERMRDFLRRVACPDGEIPLVGDAARNFAPPAAALCGGVVDSSLPRGIDSLADSGLHVFRGDGLWAIFDAGRVCPDYLPAHGQADTLTVEIWFGGRRIVADPGVAEYTGPERAWGRSSRAHSTVTVDDRDTSEVYGSFRVGGRAVVEFVETVPDRVTAAMRPWGTPARFTRVVRFADPARRGLGIEDEGTIERGRTARSRLHLAPEVRILEGGEGATALVVASGDVRVRIVAANPVRLEPGHASREFGLVEPTMILVQDMRRESERPEVRGGWLIEPVR